MRVSPTLRERAVALVRPMLVAEEEVITTTTTATTTVEMTTMPLDRPTNMLASHIRLILLLLMEAPTLLLLATIHLINRNGLQSLAMPHRTITILTLHLTHPLQARTTIQIMHHSRILRHNILHTTHMGRRRQHLRSMVILTKAPHLQASPSGTAKHHHIKHHMGATDLVGVTVTAVPPSLLTELFPCAMAMNTKPRHLQ